MKRSGFHGSEILTLVRADHELHFNPRTGLLNYSGRRKISECLSDSVFNFADFVLVNRNDSSLNITYPVEGLSLHLVFGHNLIISAKFESTKPQTLLWPGVSISKSDQ